MPKPWTLDYQDRWSVIIAGLHDVGIEAKLLTVAAPVQIEGHLPSGTKFYFSCRYDNCELAIGGDDPAGVPEWRSEIRRWGEFEASYLTPEEASKVFLELLDQYPSVGDLDIEPPDLSDDSRAGEPESP